MNVKHAFTIILLFLILFSAISVVSADDDRSYTIDHAFIDLIIENNGLLHVDEQFDYSFDGKFNGVYRDIPLKSGESIENIQVSADGAYPVLKESDDNGYKHLKIYLYSDKAHTKGIRDCDVSVYISYDLKKLLLSLTMLEVSNINSGEKNGMLELERSLPLSHCLEMMETNIS